MAEPCLNCVIKHLSQAMIVHEEEVCMGYPEHVRRVIGHLGEASRESVGLYPELASNIREHRIRVMEDASYLPPYNNIMDYVDFLIVCEDKDLPIPELPESLRLKEPA